MGVHQFEALAQLHNFMLLIQIVAIRPPGGIGPSYSVDLQGLKHRRRPQNTFALPLRLCFYGIGLLGPGHPGRLIALSPPWHYGEVQFKLHRQIHSERW